jgi:hypothetical protein
MVSHTVAQSDENRANPAPSNDFAPFESMPALRHDPNVAVAFLKWLDPQGRHNLWAKHPERGTNVGQSFPVGDWHAIERFIKQYPAHNIYFSANEPVTGAPHKKLSTSDIESVRCAFIDCDPPADLEQAGKQAEARDTALENANRAFTSGGALLDSGGGFQVIWRLKEKLSAKTDGTKLEDQNRGLAALFGGDKAVRDVPRVLRLPGTVNWPDEAKRKRGRIPRRSSVQYRLPADGDLDKVTLPRLAEVAPPVHASAGSARGEFSGVRLNEETPNSVERMWKYIREEAPEAIEGNAGDATTHQVAKRIFDFGVNKDTGWEGLLEWNETKAHPPWDVDELEAKLEGGLKYRQRPPGVDNPDPGSIFDGIDFGEGEAATIASAPPDVQANAKLRARRKKLGKDEGWDCPAEC